GRRDDGEEVKIDPYGVSMLVAGPSGSGKSTFAVGFIERVAEQSFQFCVVDPEGDYPALGEAVHLGTVDAAPDLGGVTEVLAQPRRNAIVNLLGLPLADRPAFFESLMARLEELRAKTGHPHWIVIDEAHHMIPPASVIASRSRAEDLTGFLMITVHPEEVAAPVLAGVEVVVGVGEAPESVITAFCRTLDLEPPPMSPVELASGDVLVWLRSSGAPPFRIRPVPGRSERRRHVRKYAQGDLGEDRSFYFKGPEGKLNLRAQNLALFVQLADGVDDATWLHHLRQGGYSSWFREAIKDEELANEAAQIEAAPGSADESKAAVRRAVEQRYTLSA
ncbi:MAG TPA: type IV secretory system conjugative DNA transfer family protein, partial [Candidatus Limnocylindrales bacterium]|nr:type IV secretory system conjugative DNA transfer family protein [Candidatus Limnocylindrales bacterium]